MNAPYWDDTDQEWKLPLNDGPANTILVCPDKEHGREKLLEDLKKVLALLSAAR